MKVSVSDLIRMKTQGDLEYLRFKRQARLRVAKEDQRRLEGIRKRSAEEPSDDRLFVEADRVISDFSDNEEPDGLIDFDERYGDGDALTSLIPTARGITYQHNTRGVQEVRALEASLQQSLRARNYEHVPDSELVIRHGRRWTTQETAHLVRLVEQFGINFSAISIHMPTRPRRSLAAQYKRLLRLNHPPLKQALSSYHARMRSLAATRTPNTTIRSGALGGGELGRERGDQGQGQSQGQGIISDKVPNYTNDPDADADGLGTTLFDAEVQHFKRLQVSQQGYISSAQVELGEKDDSVDYLDVLDQCGV
ncbi:Myb-like DNA-binding domain-containing protein [Giardia muris]|uniref:Myb-like DNA-binding domain-containing protein n=1 Tax=Giardia muris TaxID=5742 RepID=A0A4Z1SY22_GIAMU|nr:Myb-like DNA-binding domain-containing protein [Giardia muris]|eukprot:TNJ28408.1 Myb-like DNA-binding domain-containing protein [Giardia muris]